MAPSRSVLIVDDEPALREILADACADLDIQVYEAASAKEALEITAKKKSILLLPICACQSMMATGC